MKHLNKPNRETNQGESYELEIEFNRVIAVNQV